MQTRISVVIICFICFIFFAAGCKETKKEEVATKKIERKAKAKKPDVKNETPEAKTPGKPEETKKPEKPKVWRYSPNREDGKRRRDPFRRIRIKHVTSLQQYEIPQMGVTGVMISDIKQANVITPNCKSHFVEIGAEIGTHDGVIIDITLKGVKVEETYSDDVGKIYKIERLIPNRPYGKCK